MVTSNREPLPHRPDPLDSSAGFRLLAAEIHPNACSLTLEGERRRVDLKAMRVLLALAARPGRDLPRAEILEEVWPGAAVTDDVLTVAVSTLRRALGDDARDPTFIQTIPRVGYRLLVTPEAIRPDSPPAANAAAGSTPAASTGRLRWAGGWARFGLAAGSVLLLWVAAGATLRPVEESHEARAAGADSAGVGTAPEAATPSRQVPTGVDPQVYDAFLRGRFLNAVGTPEALRSAIEILESARRAAPGFAPAEVALAESWIALGEVAPDEEPRIAFAAAKAAAERALLLDPTQPGAHGALAVAQFLHDLDFEAAEASFARALALDPEAAEIHRWHAWYLATLGRFEEALGAVERRIALDPSAYSGVQKASILNLAGRSEQALAELGKRTAVAPDDAELQCELARTYGILGRFDEGFAAFHNALEWSGTSPGLLSEIRLTFEGGGTQALCRAELTRLESAAAGGRPFRALDRAEALAWTGETSSALDWLEIALDRREPEALLVAYDPAFEPLRENPRFVRLIERLGLPL